MATKPENWLNLLGNEVGAIYAPSRENRGYKTLLAGFIRGQIKPGDLVRVYAGPSVYDVPITIINGNKENPEEITIYTNCKDVLGFSTYRVNDNGKLEHTLGIDTRYEKKEWSPEEILGKEKIYKILK